MRGVLQMNLDPRLALKTLVVLMIALTAASWLNSCGSNPQHTRIVTNEDGTQSEVTEQRAASGGMLEHMAGAAVAGAAAGTAGAVAHRATDHLINKHQERKAARRAKPRTYNHRR